MHLAVSSGGRVFGQTPAVGHVLDATKISDLYGGFTGALDDVDEFGNSVVGIGDLDGDGVPDMAVGAHLDDDGGAGRGAVWILFLEPDGTVKAHAKISETAGGFTGVLEDFDSFGSGLAFLGDLDGDGMIELAVGASGDDDAADAGGATWVLTLGPDGAVQGSTKITSGVGGFFDELAPNARFGRALASIGDFDGDGVADLAAGSSSSDPVDCDDCGTIWILFMNTDGSVKSHTSIHGSPEFRYGNSISGLIDLDGNGVNDLVTGWRSHNENEGGFAVLLLAPDGSVIGEQIASSDSIAQLDQSLEPGDFFAWSLASASGLMGGTTEVVVVPALVAATVWVLFLDASGIVLEQHTVPIEEGKFGFSPDPPLLGSLGHATASIGDLGGDGFPEIAVGAKTDSDGGQSRGAVWILSLAGSAPGSAVPFGCGFNPPASTQVLAGTPTVGAGLRLGVDNPVGSQTPGSLAMLALSLDTPAAPCGPPIPGSGMAGFGSSGELLVELLPPFELPLIVGEIWTGPGEPASVTLPVPDQPGLAGLLVFVQGLLLDPAATTGPAVGLGSGLRLHVSP